MADAADSKSAVGDYVWVQVPSPAFKNPLFYGISEIQKSKGNQEGNQSRQKEPESREISQLSGSCILFFKFYPAKCNRAQTKICFFLYLTFLTNFFQSFFDT